LTAASSASSVQETVRSVRARLPLVALRPRVLPPVDAATEVMAVGMGWAVRARRRLGVWMMGW